MKKMRGTNYQSGRWRRHFFPVLIWIGTLSLIVVLFQDRSRRFEVVGLAQADQLQIAATQTGRLKGIYVGLFQEVKQGQKLAELSDELLQAELNTSRAEALRLQAELAATEDRLNTEAANRDSDRQVDNRTFSTDVERSRLRILELKAQLETLQLQRQNVQSELQRVKNLVATDSVLNYEAQQLEAQENVLQAQITNYHTLLDQAQSDLAQAEDRRELFLQKDTLHPSLQKNLDLIVKAIDVQEHRMKQIEQERQTLVLTSPRAGVVSQILCKQGEAVMAGVPIMTIAETYPTEIIAFAGESQVSQIQVGMKVEIVKKSNPPQIAESEIIRIGPNVQTKPEILWRSQNLPERGRPCMIAVHPGMKLVPGEKVGIRGL